ncbi:hypothetical protein ZIOFF_021990 [Zingiber officinale]|uniref:Cysteine proteinase inhibitor n=1 Tax=Zingiber officinale TaxID=94328 RepID=A0A8J5HJH6_ZINOF|nr:hypothetical protein ZIOFF_021990 [Zingiber officinale]
MEFARVVKAREQVVARTLHHLTVEAVEGGEKKLYEAKVRVKPWLNFKQVEEFKHVGEQDGKDSNQKTQGQKYTNFSCTDCNTEPSAHTINVPKSGKLKDLIQVYANCIIRFLDEPSDLISLIPKDAEKSPVVIFAHQRLEE